jgi:hypothetical protein
MHVECYEKVAKMAKEANNSAEEIQESPRFAGVTPCSKI